MYQKHEIKEADDTREMTIDELKANHVDRPHRKPKGLPLKALRELRNLTQREVAEKADMNQGDLSRLERRPDVRISSLVRYAEALGGKLEVYIHFDGLLPCRVDLTSTDTTTDE